MSSTSVLLAGESQQNIGLHVAGNDVFAEASYTEAGDQFLAALEQSDIETTHIPCHVAASDFPDTPSALTEYDVVILSDIGSDTLRVPPSTVWECERNAERLPLLEDYVLGGGALLMIGGYLSFQGYQGKAGYRQSAVEHALPVTLDTFDDRVERSDGATPKVVANDHPVLTGIPDEWPHFLGYNRVVPDDDAVEVLSFDSDPLLVVGDHGAGRTAAFTSDCAPHWGPPEFTEWDGYANFWSNLVTWLAGGNT